MTAYIEHEDILDVRDLGTLAREQDEVLNDVEADADDKEDALDTLKELSSLLTDLGHQVSAEQENAGDKIADVFTTIMETSSPTLIADHYFVDAMEEDIKDLFGLPRELPGCLVIDWEATAENMKGDYSKVTLDGHEYFIRR